MSQSPDERAIRRLIRTYTARRDWFMFTELGYLWAGVTPGFPRTRWFPSTRDERGSAAVGAVLILSAFTVFLIGAAYLTRTIS